MSCSDSFIMYRPDLRILYTAAAGREDDVGRLPVLSGSPEMFPNTMGDFQAKSAIVRQTTCVVPRCQRLETPYRRIIQESPV